MNYEFQACCYVVLAIVVVAGVCWRLLQHGSSAKVTYETGDVDRGAVQKSISSTGSVAALVTVEVGSQISGQVSSCTPDFNSRVKKNELLAVIDPQTYKARVASAEADLAVARATVGSQQASLRKAQTTLDQARRDADRQKLLAEQKLIAQSAAEDSLKQPGARGERPGHRAGTGQECRGRAADAPVGAGAGPHRPVAHADPRAQSMAW